MKKIPKLILINLFVFILLLVLIEALLHIIPPFDRFITYADAEIRGENDFPNGEYTYVGNNIGMISKFKVHVKNNSLGFHDKEYSFIKKPGVKRIIVLGDSQVEAVQVDLSGTFHKILEKKLNNDGFNVEVIALGKSGYGIKEAIDLYENIGKKYDPDIVIWSFTNNNDIQDTDRKFGRIIVDRKLKDLAAIPDFLKFSKIATYLYTREWIFQNSSPTEFVDTTIFNGEFSYINGISNWDQIVFLKYWPPLFNQIRDSFSKYYLDFIEKVHSDGKILITISSSGAYPFFLLKSNENIEWDFDKPNRIVEELSNKNSVRFLSMKSTYDLYIKKTARDVVFPFDGHLNEIGHELVAEAMYPEIKHLLNSGNTISFQKETK